MRTPKVVQIGLIRRSSAGQWRRSAFFQTMLWIRQLLDLSVVVEVFGGASPADISGAGHSRSNGSYSWVDETRYGPVFAAAAACAALVAVQVSPA
jgi:hypothetical protein